MIRKFNYTGRKRIPRSNVRIDLFRDSSERLCFNISLHLDRFPFPESASIYVEAYHRAGYQRFDFGTVARMHIPADRTLRRFPRAALPLFRVKVVDRAAAYGKILASLDKIRPESIAESPVGSRCLLFVEYEDLGNSIWQLSLDGDWPVLKLNRQVEEISLIAASDNRFQALVYPEVLRQILTRILIHEGHTDPDCDDDWQSLWLKLASTLPGMSPPPAEDAGEQYAWIEQTVEALAARQSLLDRFRQALREG